MEDKQNKKTQAKSEQEQWVPVPDEPYKKTYMVSNMGQIKNKNTGKIKSLSTNQGGFTYVRLDIGKTFKKITYQMHQLVAQMFIGDCPENYCVVHNDSNKGNNSASNLTYMSKSAATQRYYNKKNNKENVANKSDSESESNIEQVKPIKKTSEVKQVMSNKMKQQLSEKNCKKVNNDNSSSESDSESDDDKVSIKDFKALQNRVKTLEKELISLKDQLKTPNKQKIKDSIVEPTVEIKSDNSSRKKIPGFSKYEIDRTGIIYDCISNYVTKPYVNSNGYYRVSLTPDGATSKNRQNKYLQRLVAETFIPNPKNSPFVNHINANKLDNRVENLEWCTASENMLHESRLKKTGKRVYAFDSKTGKFYKSFESIKAAGRDIGVDSTTITKVINGDRLLAGGYFWKQGEYDNEDDISDIDEDLLNKAKSFDRYRKNKIAPKKETKPESSDSETDSESESD